MCRFQMKKARAKASFPRYLTLYQSQNNASSAQQNVSDQNLS